MAVCWRGIWVVLVLLGSLLGYPLRRFRLGPAGPSEVERLRGECLADLLQRLGSAYVKLGQILGSRPDLLPPGYIKALARLQDAVRPLRFSDVVQVLDQEWDAEQRAEVVQIDPEPLAAASVAQVHRGRLLDGSSVALKIQRPRAAAQIHRDLVLMRWGAGVLDRLPSLRMFSLPGAIARFGEALVGQLDFRCEAENNRRFASNFESWERLRVPDLVPSLCTRRVLAMELIEGVKPTEAAAMGADPRELGRLGACALLKMIFEDGFVHADLHPGNILCTPQGIVMLDLGMVGTVASDLVRPFVETNMALAQQDGAAAARLFYVHAPTVGTSDYQRYERDVCAYFEGLYGKQLGEIEVRDVIGEIMNILRVHRVQVDPSFTVIHVAMLVAEGLGKQLDPEIDMVALSFPYLQKAMQEGPPGRLPARDVPVDERPGPGQVSAQLA